MARAKEIKTGLVRLSYVNDLFTPRSQEEGKSPKYGCTLLVPKSDTATLNAMQENIIEACVGAQWGDAAKIREMIQNGIIRLPVLDGDGPQGINKKTSERREGYAGHFFVRTSSGQEYPPQVFDEYVQKIASGDASRIKSGDFGYAVIQAYSWDHPKNGKGVTFGISGIQKVKSGDALGGSGGGNAEQFFKPEAVGGESAPDETKGGAGAAGLFG